MLSLERADRQNPPVPQIPLAVPSTDCHPGSCLRLTPLSWCCHRAREPTACLRDPPARFLTCLIPNLVPVAATLVSPSRSLLASARGLHQLMCAKGRRMALLFPSGFCALVPCPALPSGWDWQQPSQLLVFASHTLCGLPIPCQPSLPHSLQGRKDSDAPGNHQAGDKCSSSEMFVTSLLTGTSNGKNQDALP